MAERRHVKNASWIWRESCGDVVSKGLCFIMSRAVSLDVWKDSWIPWADGFKPKPKNNETTLGDVVVAKLIDWNLGRWDLE